jgi:hypothetical protein
MLCPQSSDKPQANHHDEADTPPRETDAAEVKVERVKGSSGPRLRLFGGIAAAGPMSREEESEFWDWLRDVGYGAQG